MKIAVIASMFPKLSETFILNQITGLCRRGHQVRIFSRFSPAETIFHPEVGEYNLLKQTVYLPSVPSSKWCCRLKAFAWLLRFLVCHPVVTIRVLRYLLGGPEPFSYLLLFHSLPILSFHPDVIFVHYGHNGNLFIPLKEIEPKAAFMTMFHGHDLLLGQEGGPAYYRRLFAQADLVLANSEFTRRRLLEQGADPSRLRIHYVGVETEKFPFRGGLPVRQDGVFRILTVCRLCGQKGLDTSLRAVRELINMIPSVPIEYRIVGDGPDREMLENLTEELGLKEYVVFAGPMEQSGVVEQMRQADVFLLTSVYEWLGVVLLEAQAIGLPIVATNVGGIPEAVSAGESAILVPPSNPRAAAEALAECLRHPEKREKMGLAGRKHVEEHFDIDRLNDRLEQLFLEISQTVKKNQPVRPASSGMEEQAG